MNHKDERIYKLWLKGLSVETIARKIGIPGNSVRVIDGLKRKGVTDAQIELSKEGKA